MIKPESNAPAPMKPWVRTTDKQIEQLETAVAKINSVVNSNGSSVDHEQNQSLSNTFSFTPLDDGSTSTNAQGMNFTGPVTSESDLSIAGSLVVGDPSRQEYDPLSGEAIGSIPNLEVISGQLEVNPITEVEYYTTGQLNMTDTAFNVDSYGLINGDGLQITLANDGDAERQNIEILGATGDGTNETFQIANNTSNAAIYTAGKYVNITGVDPAGYNGENLLITSVNTGVSPMTFTVGGTESGTYLGGGYATINQANSIYEGKLTVQGPSPDYSGVTVSQDGVFVGSNGGDTALADVVLDSTGLTAPSAFIDQAVINGTRLFISDTPPTAVNDGDIWIDKVGIFTQGTSYVLPKATASALGGVELFDATVQPTAANSVTTTAGRTYGVQMNSADQLVVNVPWTAGGSGFTGAGTSVTGVQSAAGVALPISTANNTTASGAITIATGQTTTAALTTGTLTINTGDSNSSGGNSGAITIKTGAGSGTNGNSGSLTIDTGAGSGGGSAGSITIGATSSSSVTIGRAGGSTTIAGTLTALPTLPSTAQQLHLASPTSGAGTPTFRYISTSDFTQSSTPVIGQALVAAPVTGGWSWGGPYLTLTGGTLSTGALTLTPPTSTVSSLVLPTGTQPTLASQTFGQVSSGVESVGLATTKTTGAGPGFGIVQAPQMVFSLADSTSSSSTTPVSVFAAANDTLSSLEPAKLYKFKIVYYPTFTYGGTSASAQINFAFSAAPASIKYSFLSWSSLNGTTLTYRGHQTSTSAQIVIPSQAASGAFVCQIDGYFISHATLASTFTPQFSCTAAVGGSSYVMSAGSYIEIQKIGTSTQTLISGNWA